MNWRTRVVRQDRPKPSVERGTCERSKVVMKKSIAWPLILAMAVLLAWVDPVLCGDKTPAEGTAVPAVSSSLQPGGPLPSGPPSSVSPAIERFLRESGKDRLPAPTLPPSSRTTRPASAARSLMESPAARLSGISVALPSPSRPTPPLPPPAPSSRASEACTPRRRWRGPCRRKSPV